MSEPIRAIDTRYRGFLFRSRLEARWAVFFDAMGIPFRYEPEGFAMGTVRYLPDFYLPRQNCWIEVKPTVPGQDIQDRVASLANATRRRAYILFGDLLTPWSRGGDGSYADYAQAFAFFPGDGDMDCMDYHYLWCECQDCHEVGLQFEGRSDRLPCKRREPRGLIQCHRSQDGDTGYNFDSPRLRSAYDRARAARFEWDHSSMEHWR